MALATFTYFNVLHFPINIRDLIKREGIKLKKYSILAKNVGISVEQVCEEYQTNMAYIYRSEDTGKYSIAYNDTLPEYIIRFSLAHELGHYALMHLEDFDETILRYRGFGLTEEKYKVLENEANCFARNLLSPAPIATIIPTDIYQPFFGIGHQAGAARVGLLKSDVYYTKLVKKEIDKKTITRVLRQLKYTYQCHNCQANFYKTSKPKFCPICKEDILEKLTVKETANLIIEGGYMEYSAIKLNENLFPSECPRCKNENIDESSKFCNICGTYLLNICLGDGPFDTNYEGTYPRLSLSDIGSGCGAKLPGQARYCQDCGGVSSYYNQELLSFWENEWSQNELEFLF